MKTKLDLKSLFIGFALALAPAVAIVSIWGLGHSQSPSLRTLKKEVPESLNALTASQLASKQPRYYEFGTGPGKRVWRRVNADTWHEEYPDGFASVFRVLGHARVRDTEGTIVAKVAGHPNVTHTANDGTLQAFIPDRGSERMYHLCRDTSQGAKQWYEVAEMQEVQ
jgi:hypothetical protein